MNTHHMLSSRFKMSLKKLV